MIIIKQSIAMEKFKPISKVEKAQDLPKPNEEKMVSNTPMSSRYPHLTVEEDKEISSWVPGEFKAKPLPSQADFEKTIIYIWRVHRRRNSLWRKREY